MTIFDAARNFRINTIVYRKDPDLSFLENCKNEDLELLFEVLTKDKKGKPRLTQQLTLHRRYRWHNPDHHAYWDLIAAELQGYGASSISTLLRGGRGVAYREILFDVCDKLSVKYNKETSTRDIEMNLLMKLLEDSLEKMNDEQLREVVSALQLKTALPTKEAVLAALQAAVKIGGFSSYATTVVVANAVLKSIIGRGLTFAGNAMLTRAVAVFAGPIGWVITGIWTLVDVAGPAYRVTIPACVVVAFLREKGQTDAGDGDSKK